LILEGRDAEQLRCGEVIQINDTVTEHKESGKDVAGDRCEKKIGED
jgi:hypothetical protein